eukprot:763064-Hanusia_phi.AAC.1
MAPPKCSEQRFRTLDVVMVLGSCGAAKGERTRRRRRIWKATGMFDVLNDDMDMHQLGQTYRSLLLLDNLFFIIITLVLVVHLGCVSLFSSHSSSCSAATAHFRSTCSCSFLFELFALLSLLPCSSAPAGSSCLVLSTPCYVNT